MRKWEEKVGRWRQKEEEEGILKSQLALKGSEGGQPLKISLIVWDLKGKMFLGKF